MSDVSLAKIGEQLERLARSVEGARALAGAAYERSARWPERLEEIRSGEQWRQAYAQAEPLVSVRMATWNRAELLVERALASVQRQTYSNWEAVVVGDACTDDTEERIAALGDPRIRFHNLATHSRYPQDPRQRWLVIGMVPMNTAARMARGSWIAPLDDDDEWEDDHLEVLVEAALSTRAELVYGRFRGLLHDPPMEAVMGAWPPRKGEFAFQAAIYNAALRELEYDPMCRFLDEPGDWNLARRMWEAGVRFELVDRIVSTWHCETAPPWLVSWFEEHPPPDGARRARARRGP